MSNSSSFFTFSNAIALIALIVAALSLIVASLNSWMQYRNQITVYIDSALRDLSPQHIYLNGLNNQFKDVEVFFKTQVDVVNYCSHDIAFFDLRVFNPSTNFNHQFISKKAFPHDLPSDTKISINDGVFFYNYNVEVPDKNYGIFKAHSFTRFDIIIYDFKNDSFEDQIELSFKISKKNLFRVDPYAVTNRKKFKIYTQNYDINWLKKKVIK